LIKIMGRVEANFRSRNIRLSCSVLDASLLNQLQRLAMWWLNEYASEKMALHFRSQLFQQAQRLSLTYHDKHGVAEATYHVQYDAPAIQRLTTWGLIPIVSALCTLLGMVVVTARISLELALISLAVSPVFLVLTRLYSKKLWARWQRVKELETSAFAVVQEVLGTIRVVVAFGQESRELDRFVRHSASGLWERLRVVMTQSAFGLCVGLTIGTGTALELLIGLRQVQAGTLTLGELLLVMAYLTQLYDPLQQIGQQIASQQESLASAERAFTFLDEASVMVERRGAKPLARAQGAVAFRHVAFAYREDHPVLCDISFEVAPGTRVGIAGPSGAGKTTLVSLLMRFYDPTAGAILVDGTDLRDYKLHDLRNQFAIVLQEPLLFSTSVAANIAYAQPQASMAAIIAAAQAANAHDFIARLPQSYETPVGDRGMQLSGGERQRIALARAFLKDAPLLILDEPTNSVDIRTEAAIMEALERLTENRTSFLITHRVTTLKHCDVLLNIEDGRLKHVASISQEG
jgi:ATP-binding cassette subfamily B protein